MKPLLILGAGDFAAEVADLASEIEGFKPDAFVQNINPDKAPQQLEGLPVLWVEEARVFLDTHWAVCAIGSTCRRAFIEQVSEWGMRFTTLVHPTARVSKTADLGEGCIVSAGAVIAAYARLGRHTIVNRGALVGHHSSVGDWSTIGPGANIAGRVSVGEENFIGIGAIVSDHLTIGKHCFLCAGALVLADVPDGQRVLGRRERGQKL